MLARNDTSIHSSERRRCGLTSGFTVLEMVVVMAIIVILVAMLVPASITFLESQRAEAAAGDLKTLHTAIVGNPKDDDFGYLGDVGDYPASLLDLVNATSTGWSGPYVTDVQIDNNLLIDAFGGGIELFNEIDAAALGDRLALISKGPDLTSSSKLPTDLTYGADAENLDNVVLPNFVENMALLGYEPVGTLAYTVINFDTNPRQAAPGCPALYTMTVTSVPRGSADKTALPFNPGFTDDLVQGFYDVTFTSPEAPTPVWQERVRIGALATVTKSVTLNVDTRRTPTYTLEVTNGTGNRLRVFEFDVDQGNCNAGPPPPCVYTGISACAPMRVEERVSVGPAVWETIDQFSMPYLENMLGAPTAFAKTYPPTLSTLCITNLEDQKIIVYQDNLVRGTIHRFGSSKRKCFSDAVASDMECRKQDGTPVACNFT